MSQMRKLRHRKVNRFFFLTQEQNHLNRRCIGPSTLTEKRLELPKDPARSGAFKMWSSGEREGARRVLIIMNF